MMAYASGCSLQYHIHSLIAQRKIVNWLLLLAQQEE
jgi:hypothetical protein